MNAKTLTALKESIAHWKRMRDDPDCGEEPYDDCCPLCKRHSRDRIVGGEGVWTCYGCPVKAFTGKHGCEGSPWLVAKRQWLCRREGGKALARFRHAAQKEIDFLESLLPKGMKP